MKIKPINNYEKLVVVMLLMTLPVCSTLATELDLIGFQKIADDLNTRRSSRLYKLSGKTYQLHVNQSGSYSLELFPKELFQIEKLSGNQFNVTLIDPRSLWKKHQEKSFKISWKIDEIIEY